MIYLIAIREHGLCKIGYAKNVARRVAVLQTGCPFALELVSQREGTARDEASLHASLSHLRVRGEWFIFNEEAIEVFNGVRAPRLAGSPTFQIVHTLGGATALARGTGISVQTVHSWLSAEIPPWRRPAVFDFARREGKLADLSEDARAYLTSTERTVGKAA